MKIRGYCPMGCGESLIVGSGGHLVCGFLPCPNPTAIAELLEASDMYTFGEFVSASADKLIELLSSAPVPRALPSRAACAIRAASAENRRGEG